jgi:transcriptional regulator with XRE-family HTH domain
MNERLKAAREARGWSMVQIASYLELMNDQSYRNWEHGRSRPSEKNLNKLCHLLRKSKEELGFA